MESDRETVAVIYYSSSLRDNTFHEDKTKRQAIRPNVRAHYNFDLDNKVVKTLRFDPGREAGRYRLYSLTPSSFYGKMEPIEPFRPEVSVEPGPGTSIVKKDGYVEITAETADPYVIIKERIKASNPILLWLTPAVIALLAIIACSGFQISDCAFWLDTLKKSPSGGLNYNTLDGMRGLAALFVLVTHTGVPGCDSLGHVGVDFFFTLSGFLLTLPFAKDGSLILSTSKVGNYYLRRLRRIVPMFYFVMMIVYLFNDRIDVFIRSALFIQGNSIYWTVLQEVHFYLFLPVLLLINHLVLRDNKWLIIGLLLVLSYCFNNGLLATYHIFALGNRMTIYAGLFLNGIIVSYLCQIDWVRNSRGVQRFWANPVIGGLLLAAIFGIEQLWALSHNGQVRNSAYLLSGHFTYLVALLVILLVLAPQSLPGKLFNALPLRIMGTVSYSFYLLHPVSLGIVKAFAVDYLGHPPDAGEKFLYTLVLTFFLSTITYQYIERPFLKSKKAGEGAAGRLKFSPR